MTGISLPHSPAFRNDINGLRAYAVGTVVLFHFGTAPFHGGFIGVDVFFVISGFLMTQILASRLARGDIGLGAFYAARIRRILPALCFVALATLATAAFLLLPGDLVRAAREAQRAVLFVINLSFSSTTDYFAPGAANSWFLHTWSLAVEIQFYLIIPLFLMAARAASPRHGMVLGLAAMALVSLATSIVQTKFAPIAAFYLPFSRFWEFALGGVAALLPPPRRFGSVVATLGLAGILAAAALYRETMAYPGAWPLLPAGGTALTLWAASNVVLLSNPVAQFLGTYSYSIYLWHWPVLLSARYLGLTGHPASTAGMIALTLGLSLISYHLVETPFRRGQGRAWPLGGAAAGIAAVIVAGGYIVQHNGLPERIPHDIRRILATGSNPQDWRQRRCFLDPDQAFKDLSEECLPRNAEKPTLLVWGDSGAAALYPGIVRQGWAAGYAPGQVTASACSSYPGTVDPVDRPYCKDIQDNALQWIKRNKPRVVLLSVAVQTYDEGTSFGQKLSTLVTDLRESGVARVVVAGQVPVWPLPLPEIFYRESVRQSGAAAMATLSRLGPLRRWDDVMRQATTANGGIYVSILDGLCRGQQCMTSVPGADGVALVQFDSFHFTKHGADWVAANLIGPALVSP